MAKRALPRELLIIRIGHEDADFRAYSPTIITERWFGLLLDRIGFQKGRAMKRDMDLVRTILLEIEQKASPEHTWLNLKIGDRTESEISYHVQLLADARLVEAIDLSSSDGPCIMPKRLTWAGHEFLDAARQDTIWNAVKKKLGPMIGSVTLDVFVELLKAEIRRNLGLGD